MQVTVYHRRISGVLFSLGLALTLYAASTAPAGAQSYTFSNVTDSTQGLRLFSPPDLNNNGTLSFLARVDGTSTNGIFTKAVGEPRKTIALTNLAPFTNFGGLPTINASGTVAFEAHKNSSPTQAIYTGDGTAAPMLVVGNESGSPFAEFGGYGVEAINDDGTVAFFARRSTGPDGGGVISTRNGDGTGPITLVADGASGVFITVSRTIDINAGGSVAFQGFAATGASTGMFVVAPGGAVTTIADDSDGFTSILEGASINDSGAVAFYAYLPGGVQAVSFGDGGAVMTIADTSGPFQNFVSAASINNAGTVAFDAILDDARRGIFTGPDPVADKVIAVGDALFGRTVADVQFFNGLNDNGDIAFMYRLDNDVSGVALAAAPFPVGDFDHDGNVDGGDFLVWQRDGSPSPLSAGDLSDWRGNFGMGSLVAANVAVPEPASLTICALGLAIASTVARRAGLLRKHSTGIALLAVLCLGGSPAQATNYWKSSVINGTWSNGNNWSANSAVSLDNAGAPTLGEAVNIAFIDGLARNITYDVTAPSLDLLSIDLVQLSGPSTVAHTLLMPSNNSLTANGVYVGGYNGAGGTNGRGALNQSAGTVTTNSGSDLVVGHGVGSTGVYTLSGGALAANQSEFIGFSGTGTFNHTGGTNTVNASAAGAFDLGGFAGATGMYNLSGSGALVVNAHEYIGDSGTGVFNQTGGTNTITAGKNLYLGFNASGRGEYYLSGGTISAPAVFVGHASTGISSFLVTGAGSTVNASSSFVVGRSGKGVLTLADGGTLAVGNGTQALDIATLAGSSGALIIGNGGPAGVLQASAVRFGLGSGFLEFNHTGNLTFATPIRGAAVSGTVHKTGPGTTTLSGTNSYTGQTAVTEGTLAISSDINLGTPPGSFKQDQLQFFGGTLRATESFTMATTRGMQFSGAGTIEVDATKTLTYPNNLTVSSGRLTKTGAGTLTLERLTIGSSGSSTLNVTGGGTLDSYVSTIGNASGEVGVTTISGPGTTWTASNLYVGLSGNGTLEVLGGGTLATTNISVIALSDASTGTATVQGSGSMWKVGGDLLVGPDGYGTLNVDNQALVNVANTLAIGSPTGFGVVNLSGGTLRFDGYIRTAFSTFNFNSGTIQLVGDRSISTDTAVKDLFGVAPAISTGRGLTVEGTATLSKPLTIDGGTFKANGLVIGAGGALDFDRGLLELTDGTITGLANLAVPTNGEFRASGVQSLRVTGAAGSTITATGNLTLGNAAAVNGFGTQGTLQVGANSVTLLDANDVVFDSLALATLGSGNSPGTLNAANGLTLDFGSNVAGLGAINTPNNAAKPLINNGHITGNSAAQRITLPGYVKGVGTFDNVNFTGIFSPGLSPTSLIVGNVALSPTSTLVMELGGLVPGSGHDQLLSFGELAFDGALQISLINGFSPTAGQSFNLFDWANIRGAFDALQLPALTGALAWNTSQLYTTGVLSINSPLLDADFDEDGDVDGADLARWKSGFGTMAASHTQGDANGDEDVDGNDFLAWQRQLGSSSAQAAGNAVPEPTGMVIIAALLLLPLTLDRRGRHHWRLHAFPGVLLAYFAFTADGAQAQTYWATGGMGDWTNPDNWSAGLPSPTTDGFINNGGTAQSFNPGQVAGYVGVGENLGAQGRLEILGGQLQVVFMRVGLDGAGSLLIQRGRLSSRFGVLGGRDPNAYGAATVRGDNSNWIITRESLVVGLFGTGWLSIENGGTVSDMNEAMQATVIGEGVSGLGIGKGRVIVDGPGSTFGNSYDLEVGKFGIGSMSITRGGAAWNDTGNIGVGSGSSGVVTVDGPGSVWLNTSVVAVGVSGAGALHITGGAGVENTLGRVGREVDSSGIVVVNGAGSTWRNSSDLSVGHFGAGVLSITAGGAVLSTAANIGAGSGSSGVTTVDGMGSAWINSSVLAVGSSGTGTLNITSGGKVSSFHGRITREAGSSGMVLIDGPDSRWDASGEFTMGTGTSSLTVQNGGVLSVANGMTIGRLGTVRGDGTIFAPHVQNTIGVIAPSSASSSLGTLSVAGNYTQSFGGSLQIELASPTSFDKFAVTGIMTLPFGSIAGGGRLDVALADGYVPQGSQSFDILDWGSLSGRFDEVLLPTLGGTLVWDASQLYTSGVLSVVGPPAASDFDGNGAVDGADLAIWQAGFGGDPANGQGDADNDGDADGGDFLVWQRQLGSPVTVSATSSVPEPASPLLVVVAAVGIRPIGHRMRQILVSA